MPESSQSDMPARTMRQLASAVRQDTAGAGARHYSLELILAGESIYGPVELSEAVKAATDNALEGLIGHLHRIEEKLVLAIEAEDTGHEDCEERIARLRAAATDVRLRDALTMGDLLDDTREALVAAYAELERAEEHHRWHHEQDGREVEPDEERLRVLMVIAEALDSLGADDG